MNDLHEQLTSISQSLASLAKEVNKVGKQVAKMQKKDLASAGKMIRAGKSTRGRASSVLDHVYEVVRRSRKGVSIAQLKEKTGLNARQISNALYKLSTKGMVHAKERGVYIKK
jgi:predicted Rossmann fold nucleotide-binding protein DprA/Smf involved in DNA uptake